MDHEPTQDQRQDETPEASVLQRAADALEDTETGEAAAVTLAPTPRRCYSPDATADTDLIRRG